MKLIPLRKIMKNLLLKIYRGKFLGFSIVGGVVLVLGLSLLTFLVEVLNFNKIIANVITTIFSVETNFLLNKYLNWNDRKGSFASQWIKFHITRVGTITFNQVLYAVLVTFNTHYLVASLICTSISTIINFFGNDKFVFCEKKGACCNE